MELARDLLTVVGVLLASLAWPFLAAYAVLAVAIFILGLTRLKGWVIRQSKRIIDP
ncbi:MAG TPA: hypothetical protein VF129_00195 [Actinomycetota bacterium]